jgi:hypothetical protein
VSLGDVAPGGRHAVTGSDCAKVEYNFDPRFVAPADVEHKIVEA